MVNFGVVRLDLPLLNRVIDSLVELDRGTLADMGSSFSTEGWYEEHFRKVLPGKEKLSVVALDDHEKPVGFWIASLLHPAAVHTHRVAVAAEWRRKGVGKAMFHAVLKRMTGDGTPPEMTLEVAASNGRALAFYRQLGFEVLRGEALKEYAEARNLHLRPTSAELVDEGPPRHVLMFSTRGA